jgi:zinc transport system substrate-binding protein
MLIVRHMKLSRNKIFFLGLFFAFSLSHASYASDTTLKVVASIAPLADFARQVGGDKVDVTLLLPPGASPHTYEPTPRTMQEISKAKIFIKIGAGLEFWADKLIAAAGKDVVTVNCSKGVALIHAAHDYEERGAGNVDPHYWLDPVIAIGMVKKIEEAYSKTDPADSSYFAERASSYIASLAALHKQIAETVKTFRTREYVTFHPAWNYFSRRYGLTVAGVVEEGPGREPTARHIDRILRELRRLQIRVVFAETQFSPKIAEAIAREAGGRVLMLDPIGGTKGRQTYIDMMRYNLALMKKAMG